MYFVIETVFDFKIKISAFVKGSEELFLLFSLAVVKCLFKKLSWKTVFHLISLRDWGPSLLSAQLLLHWECKSLLHLAISVEENPYFPMDVLLRICSEITFSAASNTLGRRSSYLPIGFIYKIIDCICTLNN